LLIVLLLCSADRSSIFGLSLILLPLRWGAFMTKRMISGGSPGAYRDGGVGMVVQDWSWRERATGLRQWPTLNGLIGRVGADPAFAAAVLVGSFAAGRADALSDIDLLLFAPDGGFAAAWERRHDLHVTGALIAWDERREPDREIGKHQWVTEDVVYVECLIATPASGCRLAEPYVVVAGVLPPTVTRRPPIARSELTFGPHPVERAYDMFKFAVRHPGQASHLVPEPPPD